MIDVERPGDDEQDAQDAQLELYVLGLLDDDAAAAVERRLQTDERARERVRELRGTVGLLGLALEPLEPSPQLKTRLFDAVQADAERERLARGAGNDAPAVAAVEPVSLEAYRQAQPSARRQRWLPWAVAAALALALAGSLLWNAELRGELDGPPELARYGVTGSGAAAGAAGEVVALPDQEAAVVTLAGVPQPDPGRVFQVWWIDSGAPEPSVTFLPNEHGVASVVVPGDVDDYRVLAITIEPDGGSAQPTSDPILMSDLTVPAQS